MFQEQDILSYLNKLKRPVLEDPIQKWIGSYNGRKMILNFSGGYIVLTSAIGIPVIEFCNFEYLVAQPLLLAGAERLVWDRKGAGH